MAVSQARVSTNNPGRYIRCLCKHWDHRFQVDSSKGKGFIRFPTGACLLEAQSDALVVTVAFSIEQIDQMQRVIADHLQRMGSGESLEIEWVRS